jgi:hypothetical protein
MYPSIYYLLIYPSFYLSTWLSIYLSGIYVTIYHLSIYPSSHPSVTCLLIHPSFIHPPTIYLSSIYYLFICYLSLHISSIYTSIIYLSILCLPSVDIHVYFYFILENIHIKQFVILTIAKCTVQWWQIYSKYYTTVTTIHLQNSFHKTETVESSHNNSPILISISEDLNPVQFFSFFLLTLLSEGLLTMLCVLVHFVLS